MENNENIIENNQKLENQKNDNVENISRAETENMESIIQFPNIENGIESNAKNLQSANEVDEKCKLELEKRDEQNLNILGKFKSVEQLAKAYENLQAEFTRRSQILKKLEQDKVDNLSKKTDFTICDNEKKCDEESHKENDFSTENSEKNAKNTEKMQKIEDFSSKVDTNENSPATNAAENSFENQQENDENKALQSKQNDSEINLQLKSLVENGQISKGTYLEIANKILQNSKLLDETNGIAQAVLSLLSEKTTDYETKIADPNFIVSLAQNNKQAYDKIINDYVDGCQRKNLPLFMTKSFGASIPASTPAAPTTLSEARMVLEKLLTD